MKGLNRIIKLMIFVVLLVLTISFMDKNYKTFVFTNRSNTFVVTVLFLYLKSFVFYGVGDIVAKIVKPKNIKPSRKSIAKELFVLMGFVLMITAVFYYLMPQLLLTILEYYNLIAIFFLLYPIIISNEE